MLGSIGFYSFLLYVRHNYGSIKSDSADVLKYRSIGGEINTVKARVYYFEGVILFSVQVHCCMASSKYSFDFHHAKIDIR